MNGSGLKAPVQVERPDVFTLVEPISTKAAWLRFPLDPFAALASLTCAGLKWDVEILYLRIMTFVFVAGLRLYYSVSLRLMRCAEDAKKVISSI